MALDKLNARILRRTPGPKELFDRHIKRGYSSICANSLENIGHQMTVAAGEIEDVGAFADSLSENRIGIMSIPSAQVRECSRRQARCFAVRCEQMIRPIRVSWSFSGPQFVDESGHMGHNIAMKYLIFLLTFSSTTLWASTPKVELILQRDDVIWGFDFFKNGRIVFSERGGKLAVYDPVKKATTVLAGTPLVFAKGQGGMLDVRVHPKTEEIYFSYSEPVKGGATTALGRAQVRDGKLVGFRKLFSAHEPNSNTIHFGSRIEFKDGLIFLTVGDRDNRHKAQDLSFHNGKVLRLTEDGAPAPGNPFAKKAGAKPEIWSYGHRNPQGLVLDAKTGELWEAEFGPRGGDELNLVKQGLNYGWPVITYGREYYGPKIGEGASKAGMEQPVVHWTPSISPSALTVYRGSRFPEWEGQFFLACLSGTRIQRVKLQNGKAVEQEILLADQAARFRNIRTGPDGYIYFSTDDGKIGRVYR